MKICILCNSGQQKEVEQTGAAEEVELVFPGQRPSSFSEYDAVFDLNEDEGRWQGFDFTVFEGRPVVIHAVTATLKQLSAPKNIFRICAWPTMLARNTWEVAGNFPEQTEPVFRQINRKIVPVQDRIGLIAPRIIASIINEAHIALKEGVSTPKEIDEAMKLGTNYPYGPFEWEALIGKNRIYELLVALARWEKGCRPAFTL